MLSAPPQKLGLDFAGQSRLRDAMDKDTRELIDALGAELAAIMEDASAIAAMLRGVSGGEIPATLTTLERATSDASRLVAAMHALADRAST